MKDTNDRKNVPYPKKAHNEDTAVNLPIKS